MNLPLFEFGAFGHAGALVVALLIGVAFGWTLERAGLGHAPKLAGQFYLTDLTVFKVMFSAVVTAMLGAYWMGRLDWLDLARVYVPETFFWPQLIGGLLFGVGFLAAGLCPGTSCVAAASGRVDGLTTVGGMFGGVLLTGLLFRPLEPFYNSSAWGTVTLADWSGASYGAIVAVVAVMALLAFWGIERLKLGPADTLSMRSRRLVVGVVVVGAVGAPLAGSPYRASHARVDVASLATTIATEADHVTAVELAQWLRDQRPNLRVLDVSGESDRLDYLIPSATRVEMSALTTLMWSPSDTLVVYSSGGAHGAQAWVLLRALGYRDVYFLRGGLDAWLSDVMMPVLPRDATDQQRKAFEDAAALSLYFDGEPSTDGDVAGVPAPAVIERLRRRGC